MALKGMVHHKATLVNRVIHSVTLNISQCHPIRKHFGDTKLFIIATGPDIIVLGIICNVSFFMTLLLTTKQGRYR